MKVLGSKVEANSLMGASFALSRILQMSGELVEMVPASRDALGNMQTSCRYHSYQS